MPAKPHDIAADVLRLHLEAVLQSQPFAKSDRLRRFLRFVVEQSLEGHADQLKEYTIGISVFDRPDDYDPRIDPTVRVHAGKLRARLRDYYSTDGHTSPVRIELPVGSYVPVFTAPAIVAQAPLPTAKKTTGSRRLAAGILTIAAVGVAAVAGFTWSRAPVSVGRAAWIQLTSFPDSATQPSLSPDGRSVTFVRGPGTFVTQGEIYVKPLPNGEPVQLTRDGVPKMHPVFSPDGSQVAYTTAPGRVWDTWVAPVLGGESRRLMANAEGLTWLSERQWLFSEIRKGLQMAVVTADQGRASTRDVYIPSHDLGMAHFSSISPDHTRVLVAEMDGFPALWLPCRLVPLDGSSRGRPVGPSPAACTRAAWSPDGRWMYFNADTGAGFHIWRQRYPDGPLEQVTDGPTEEEGIAIDPDGQSLVTSVGLRHSSVWVHTPTGDRQVSAEGYATASLWFSGFSPFSINGKKLYFLVRRAAALLAVDWEFWEADLDSGSTTRRFPDFLMSHYNIAPDGNRIAFAAWDHGTSSHRIFIASLDGSVPPRQAPSAVEADRPAFGPAGDIFFVPTEGASKFLYRMRPDGSGRHQVLPDPIIGFLNISPDGRWVVVRVPSTQAATEPNTVMAYPLEGGSPMQLCDLCQVGWTNGGRFIWLSLGGMVGTDSGKTFIIPLPAGQSFPRLPAAGIRSEHEVRTLPGAQLVRNGLALMGPDPSIYAFSRELVQRNLYRVPIR